MFNLAQPHGDKLAALLDNVKLPPTDKRRVNQAIEYYKKWLETLKNIRGDDLKVVPEMVSHLTSYKRYIDVELIFDSDNDFLGASHICKNTSSGSFLLPLSFCLFP
ncbi:hypothetical protein QUB35_13255, partial [Microcoleus sp. B13-B6]